MFDKQHSSKPSVSSGQNKKSLVWRNQSQVSEVSDTELKLTAGGGDARSCWATGTCITKDTNTSRRFSHSILVLGLWAAINHLSCSPFKHVEQSTNHFSGDVFNSSPSSWEAIPLQYKVKNMVSSGAGTRKLFNPLNSSNEKCKNNTVPIQRKTNVPLYQQLCLQKYSYFVVVNRVQIFPQNFCCCCCCCGRAEPTTRRPGFTCWTHLTTLGCLSSCSSVTSRMAVLGTPSSSLSRRIFFMATTWPVALCRPLYTTP